MHNIHFLNYINQILNDKPILWNNSTLLFIIIEKFNKWCEI